MSQTKQKSFYKKTEFSLLILLCTQTTEGHVVKLNYEIRYADKLKTQEF